MSDNTPSWLPADLREALGQPTMSVPAAGKAVYKANRGQSYALARKGTIPTTRGGRRKEVPTIWVRQQLMLDGPAPMRRTR